MAINISNIQLQEMYQRWRTGIQPWADLANKSNYQLPTALMPAGKRVLFNVNRFHSNYTFVYMGFTVAAILLSPILLLGIGVCLGASYFVMHRNQQNKLIIKGREITLQQQYIGVGILSFLLLLSLGAVATVMWVLGVSSMLTVIHAALYNSDNEARSSQMLLIEQV